MKVWDIAKKKYLHDKNHAILKTEGRALHAELSTEVWGKLKMILNLIVS